MAPSAQREARLEVAAPAAPSFVLALVDDHTLVRTALAGFLRHLGHTVLEWCNGREFVHALLAGTPPLDVCIIELEMPVMDGYKTLAWMRDHRPELRRMVLTVDPKDAAALKAFRHGAQGFLTKDAEPAEFQRAILLMRTMGTYIDARIAALLQQHKDMLTREEHERAQVLARLTPVDMRIIRVVCGPKELTYPRIAKRVRLSKSTVKTHVENIYRKLDVHSRPELVKKVGAWKLLEG